MNDISNKKSNLKEKIINSATSLFVQKGFNNTTLDQIVEKAGCSKGSFYHYFSSKSSILGSFTDFFDNSYMQWYETVDRSTNAVEQLKMFNDFSFRQIEEHSDLEVISALYAFQLDLSEEQHIWKSNRKLYSILNSIIKEGQNRDEIRNDLSFVEITKMFLTVQRGAVYEWSISRATYSLKEFGNKIMNLFLMALPKQ